MIYPSKETNIDIDKVRLFLDSFKWEGVKLFNGMFSQVDSINWRLPSPLVSWKFLYKNRTLSSPKVLKNPMSIFVPIGIIS